MVSTNTTLVWFFQSSPCVLMFKIMTQSDLLLMRYLTHSIQLILMETYPYLTMLTQQLVKKLSAFLNMYYHAKNFLCYFSNNKKDLLMIIGYICNIYLIL